MSSAYDNKPLLDSNVQKYVLSQNPSYSAIKLEKIQQLAIKPFLQKDFGELNDCALTSISECIYYMDPLKRDINTIYSEVEDNARKYLYKGSEYGTIIPTIGKIYQLSLDDLEIQTAKIRSKYFKTLGFNLSSIKKEIDRLNPIILSITNDGRNYYTNHTVTVIGYADFVMTGSNPDKLISTFLKNKTMLIVHDNWRTIPAYVDFDRIGFVSAICY